MRVEAGVAEMAACQVQTMHLAEQRSLGETFNAFIPKGLSGKVEEQSVLQKRQFRQGVESAAIGFDVDIRDRRQTKHFVSVFRRSRSVTATSSMKPRRKEHQATRSVNMPDQRP